MVQFASNVTWLGAGEILLTSILQKKIRSGAVLEGNARAGETNGRTNKWMSPGWMNGETNRQTDRQTDITFISHVATEIHVLTVQGHQLQYVGIF